MLKNYLFPIIIVFMVWVSPSYGQELSIRGGFVQDSLEIGQVVQYWVSAAYPQEVDLILPDSLASFSPFELYRHQWFPSQLKSGLAYDSVVYHIMSFEIDSIQKLSLPVRILKNQDTTTLYTPEDSIFFKALVPVANDTIPLKKQTGYFTVNTQFNTPLFALIAIGFVLILGVIFLLFGKRIKKYFKLKKLRKQHLQFKKQTESKVSDLQKNPNEEKAESLLRMWKVYVEKIEQIPYSKFTTKEILKLEKAKELKETLYTIDRCIYGKQMTPQLYQDFQLLLDFAENCFTEKIEKLKNDK